jgi:hypothetical protein
LRSCWRIALQRGQAAHQRLELALRGRRRGPGRRLVRGAEARDERSVEPGRVLVRSSSLWPKAVMLGGD